MARHAIGAALSIWLSCGLALAACTTPMAFTDAGPGLMDASIDAGTPADDAPTGIDGGASDALDTDAALGACESACARLVDCGGSSCATLGVDCATTMISDCAFACIAAQDCATLTIDTISDCLAACMTDAGTATDAGSTDAGTSACIDCAQGSCLVEAARCAASPACSTWLSCLQSATDAAAARACDAAAPDTALTNIQDVYTCTCTACAAECATVDPCGGVI